MWNPSSQKLMNVEEDEAGKLAAFRAKFGRGWDTDAEAVSRGGARPRPVECVLLLVVVLTAVMQSSKDHVGQDHLLDLISGKGNVPAAKAERGKGRSAAPKSAKK